MTKRRQPWAASALVLSVFVLAACEKASPPASAAQAPLPEPLSVVEPDEVAALLAHERGKVVVVSLWATWCPPCIGEVPTLVAFHKAANRSEVALIGLSTDTPSKVDTAVKPFVEEKGITFPVYVLAEPDQHAYAAALQADLSNDIPVTLFYDKQGKLRRVHAGAVDDDKLREIVMAIMR